MTKLPLKSFYMMRHGETQANAEGYAAGSFDTPLTETGRCQAMAARHVFESLLPRPALIIHSNLSRSRDSAKILNENFSLPEAEHSSMAEQCFGDWRGLSWKTIHDRIMAGEKPPNGESMEDLTDRVMTGISEILALPAEPVLIVTHGGVFDALFWKFHCKIDDVKNCHIYRFSPVAAEHSFPWDVWHHDLAEGLPISRRVVIYKV